MFLREPFEISFCLITIAERDAVQVAPGRSGYLARRRVERFRAPGHLAPLSDARFAATVLGRAAGTHGVALPLRELVRSKDRHPRLRSLESRTFSTSLAQTQTGDLTALGQLLKRLLDSRSGELETAVKISRFGGAFGRARIGQKRFELLGSRFGTSMLPIASGFHRTSRF